jgi:hypothetical protein
MYFKHIIFEDKLKWLDALYLRTEGVGAFRDSNALIDSHILMTKYRGDTTSIMLKFSLDYIFFLTFFSSTSHVNLGKVILTTLDNFL